MFEQPTKDDIKQRISKTSATVILKMSRVRNNFILRIECLHVNDQHYEHLIN